MLNSYFESWFSIQTTGNLNCIGDCISCLQPNNNASLSLIHYMTPHCKLHTHIHSNAYMCVGVWTFCMTCTHRAWINQYVTPHTWKKHTPLMPLPYRDKDKRHRACSTSHAKKTQPLTLDNHACMHTHWCQKQNHIHTCDCPYSTHDDWFNKLNNQCIHQQHADLHCG